MDRPGVAHRVTQVFCSCAEYVTSSATRLADASSTCTSEKENDLV